MFSKKFYLIVVVVLALVLSACAAPGSPANPTTTSGGNSPTATNQPGQPNATVAPAACREQQMGPFQPDDQNNPYWYIQINSEFVDSDYLFSISWQRGISLGNWQVQAGNGTWTEIVGVVRTSIREVQFKAPTSGVYWRLCAHPDMQLGNEMQQHANDTAANRSWLRVYNVGDLWASLQTGDRNLIALIKCITPATQGIPSCQTR